MNVVFVVHVSLDSLQPRPDVSITRSQTGVRPRWTKTLTERRQRKGLPRRRKCPLLLGSLSDDLVTPQLDRADRLEPVARGTGGGDEGQRRVRGRRKCPRPGAGPHEGHHPTCLYVCLISVLSSYLCLVTYNVIGHRHV